MPGSVHLNRNSLIHMWQWQCHMTLAWSVTNVNVSEGLLTWSRWGISRLIWRILTEASVICGAYFEDFPIVDHSDTADGAASTIRAVLAMLGVASSEEKDVGSSESTQMLGVVLDSGSASRGVVEIRNKPDRVESLVSSIDTVLRSGTIQRAEVPKLFGRLQFAEHQISGRVGMLAMADLRDIEKSVVGTWKLDETAIAAFENLRWRLKQSIPRVLRVRDSEKPTLVLTDGACEFLEDGSYEATVGGILYSPNGHSECFGGKVDGGLVSDWRSHKDHVIGLVELYAVVLARSHWSSAIGGRKVIFFLDNIAAMRVLIKGSSRDFSWRKLLLLFENFESECASRCWFARVPSKSNVADGPSRSEAGVSATGAVKSTPICPISKSLVSWDWKLVKWVQKWLDVISMSLHEIVSHTWMFLLGTDVPWVSITNSRDLAPLAKECICVRESSDMFDSVMFAVATNIYI